MTSLVPFALVPKLFFLLHLILILVLSSSPCFSIGTRKEDGNGLRISLQHVDSKGNFTKFERLERAMKRGRKRLEKFKAMVLEESDSTQEKVIKSTVHPGSGEFLMKLSIGTPPESFSVIMDTGSDLIWTQCKPCDQCFDQPDPVFDPEKSSSFSSLPCSNKLCDSLPMSSCTNSSCEYLYAYGDYSFTQGVLATETFTFDKVSFPEIGFGCGEDNEGTGFSQGSGLVGLGRGPLSLVSQLGETKFSYCLTSIDEDTKTSLLLMGHSTSQATSAKNSTIITTTLIHNPTHPSFYYLTLEGIKVGDTRLPINKTTFALNENGSGGLIIDSGTTISYLEESAFDLVKKEFVSQTMLSVDETSNTGLDLCFTLPSDGKAVEVPKLVLSFDGGDLELPSENYLISDPSMGLMCLAMGSSSGMSVLGNVQQQNMLVVHDLAKETISFVPAQCDDL